MKLRIGPELFFRKLMIGPFPNDLVLASVLSAACFTAAHRFTLPYVLSSLVFVLAYVTTGKTRVSILTHAVSNAVLFLAVLA